jgi:hypothetical protein
MQSHEQIVAPCDADSRIRTQFDPLQITKPRMLTSCMQKSAHPPGSAAHFPLGHIAHEVHDPETQLRGIVVRGPFSWCAYVGAPSDHFLSELEEIRFRCHYGWNYAAPGTGKPLTEGYFWWGWDYAHAGDMHLPTASFPDDIQDFIDRHLKSSRPAKDWTSDEVREHVLDALMKLRAAVQENRALAAALLKQPLPRP